MLKSLRSRFSPAKPASIPQEQALLRAIEEHRKVDPLVGAKVARRLLAALQNERGVHIESLLCAAGAIAGYSCQASLRAQVATMRLPATAAFVVVTAADGRDYFFGDPLNRLLAESRYSIWSLAAGEAQHQGCKVLPDLLAIFQRVSETVGTDRFGVPCLPEAHLPSQRPVAYLKQLWSDVQPVAQQFCASPIEWPLLFGCATQEVLALCQKLIAPDIALTILMESAVPMSKVDLARA